VKGFDETVDQPRRVEAYGITDIAKRKRGDSKSNWAPALGTGRNCGGELKHGAGR